LTLLLALLSFTAAALFVSRPWEDTVLGPELSIAPEVEVGLDDPVVVADARPPEASSDRPGVGGTVLVAAPAPRSASPVGTATPAPGIATALAVAPAEPVSSPAPPPTEPNPAPVPSPPPAEPAGEAPVSPPAPAPAPAAELAGVDAGTGGKAAAGVTPPAAPAEEICGADEAPSPMLSIEIAAGEEYALAVPFCIEPTVYGEPGADNSIVRIAGEAGEDPTFGLQLWESPASDSQAGERGLWASGEAMGGDRFLAPVEEGTWHRLAVYLEVSGDGEDLYAVYLDEEPIDAGIEVGLLAPGSVYPRVEVGFGAAAEGAPGGAGLHIGTVSVGPALD
jgi:hypothetical protein